MLISVIIPVYNREDTIQEAMNSVLEQKDSEGNNYQIELLVVDDCSTDGTVEKVLEYSDSRVRLIQLKQNSGANVTRNMGIANAIGDLIAFHDSDDVWLEGKLCHQLKLMNLKNADIVVCNLKSVQSEKKEWSFNADDSFVEVKDLLTENFLSTQCILGKSYIFKRDNFKAGFPIFQDWELALRLVQKYKVYFSKQVFVIRRVQNNSISNTNIDKICAVWDYFLKNYSTIYEKYPDKAQKMYEELGSMAFRKGYKSHLYFKKSLKAKFSTTVLVKYLYTLVIDNKQELRTNF